MRLNGTAVLHRRCGMNILMVLSGSPCALEINDSFASLWEQFRDRDFEIPDIAAFLRDEYGLDDTQAQEDADKVIALWKENGLTE